MGFLEENIRRKHAENKMKAELFIPIDALRGKLREDGYYFRMYKGVQIVQRCPDRSKHRKTAAEEANQRRFAAQYAGKHEINV